MSINGHVYQVTDPVACFGSMLFGGPDTAPTSGFEPWAGLQVSLRLQAYEAGLFGMIEADFALGADEQRTHITARDGSFSFSDPTAAQLAAVQNFTGRPAGDALTAQLWVSPGQFPFQVIYRSDLSLDLDEADRKELNIWLLPYTLTEKDGVTAGMVSGVMGGAGLPDNTTITASPSGLAFSGSHDGADVNFGIAVTGDTSADLDTFFDLTLASWDIDVNWPADWCTTADDILGEIRSGVQNAGSGVNETVGTMIQSILEKAYPVIPAADVVNFTEHEVSVTFHNVSYPNPHTWPASDTSDQTVILLAQPVIGWPRSLRSDAAKKAINLHPRILKVPAPIHPIYGAIGHQKRTRKLAHHA